MRRRHKTKRYLGKKSLRRLFIISIITFVSALLVYYITNLFTDFSNYPSLSRGSKEGEIYEELKKQYREGGPNKESEMYEELKKKYKEGKLNINQ